MKRILSAILIISLLLSQILISIGVSANTDSTYVKNEFRILTSGNEKDPTSSIKEYNENELNVGDLQGETKTSAAGNKTVRVLKAGQANVFKIEIDKNATSIQLNDFKIDSADGELYQYHFYLSDNGESFNIIGSYDGGNGRATREHGDDFSWDNVDQGWIRAQNNTDIVGRAPLNEAGDKKVLYLKLSSKGGNSEDAADIDQNAQISYVSFVVQSVIPSTVEQDDPSKGDIVDEFRVLTAGNEKDPTSAVTEYNENELNATDLQGETKTSATGDKTVRVLKAGQANVFKIEINKNAESVKINDFKIDGADGEIYQYHFYLSDDGEAFNIIGSYDGSNGRAVREHGDNFSWNNVDEGWIRAQNNLDVVSRAPLNAEGTKKVLYLKLSSKGGNSEDAADIDGNAQISYVSFVVQSVIGEATSDDNTSSDDTSSDDTSSDDTSSDNTPDDTENVKDEFRVIANGNAKNTESSVAEYTEDELKVGDLEGELKTSADGESIVRVLKGGQANVFRIEIDKKATSIQLNDFVLDSADGELYQYHFYLSDDGEKFNIIGSYNGANGRIERENGDTFSWNNVDEGWIRAQNNTDVVGRASLNADGTKKVVYLKLSAKGGDSQNDADIDESAQIAYVSFLVQSIIDPDASDDTSSDDTTSEDSSSDSSSSDDTSSDDTSSDNTPDDTENVKDEFRVLANGNAKNTESSVAEYTEDELRVGDLQGELKTSADGENMVRVLKAGEANIFRIEIDKKATSIQLNDFVLDSADGELYQYHFYLSDDGEKFNIIGSYNGANGRIERENGDTFSWSNVDEGWIRAQNNTDVVGRASLNADGTKKVVYLKLSAKGGDSQNDADIDEGAQIAYVSFLVQSIIDPDVSDDTSSDDTSSDNSSSDDTSSDNTPNDTENVKDEFRILANGNKKNENSEIPEYFEDELKVGELEGELKTSADGENMVRVLKAGEANIFRIEIDKKATSIQLNNFVIDSADGELYQYHFYLSDDGKKFNIIGSYNGANGRIVREDGDTFSWNNVDQSWIRAQNNTDVVGRASLNADGTKKVVYLKLSAKGGDSQNDEDIDEGAQIAYVSFTVQSIIDPNTSADDSNSGSNDSSDEETNEPDGELKDEFRILANGNKKNESSEVPEYFEDELKVGELEGEIKTSADGESKVRVLKGGEANVFKIEIDRNATSIQLNNFKLNSADGELYQYHFYLSDDGSMFNVIGSYNGANGRIVREDGDTFSWNNVDQSWIRAQNNSDVVGRAPLNETGDKKVLYLKLSAKGGDSQNDEDIDEGAQIAYVSFTVQSIIDPNTSADDSNSGSNDSSDEETNESDGELKDEFRILANGNKKNENSEIPEYFEDELKVGDLEGEIKTSVDGESKVRLLKGGEANVFKVEIDKKATSIRIDDFVLNSADGELYQYHFYISDDGSRFNIIGSYDGANGRIVREDGDTFSWNAIDQGWIRAQNNTEIVNRAPLNESGDKKVVYIKLSSKGGDSENPNDIDEGARIAYVSFAVKSVIGDGTYSTGEDLSDNSSDAIGGINSDDTLLKDEFRVLANGNQKDENSEVAEYFEDELKVGKLQGEIKTSVDGVSKVRLLKAGEANVFRIEIDKNAMFLAINDIKLNSADGELYQYHFYLSDDGEKFNIIGSYDGANGRIVREDGDTFSWDTVDQGWIRAQNNTDVVSRAALNEAGNKKVLYLKLSAKGGDSQNDDDIDEGARLSYVSFMVQTLIDTSKITGTEISEIRYDMSPLRKEGMSDEEWNKQQEFYSVYQYLDNRVPDEDRRVEYNNIWSQIKVIDEEEMVLVAGNEGYITYEVDLNDKTRSFTAEIFGACRNVKLLGSKDGGKTWYLIGDVGEDSVGTVGETMLPEDGINTEQCAKNIEWLLIGNEKKKFQIRVQALGDNSVLQMVNLVIYQEYVTDTEYATELPTTVPDDYEVPKAYNLVLTGANGAKDTNTEDTAPLSALAVAAAVMAAVLMLGSLILSIFVFKKTIIK